MVEPRGRVTKLHSVPVSGFKGFTSDDNSLNCTFVLYSSPRLICFTFNEVKTITISKTVSWCSTSFFTAVEDRAVFLLT